MKYGRYDTIFVLIMTAIAIGSLSRVATAAPPESVIREAEAAYKADPRPKQYVNLIRKASQQLRTNPIEAERLLKEAIALESLFVSSTDAKIELTQLYLSQKKYRQCAELCELLFADSDWFGGSEAPTMLANWATANLGLGNVRKAALIANRATAVLQTSENRPDLPVFPETEAMPYTPSEVKAVVALVYGIRSSRNNHTPEGYAATLGYYESAARLAPRLGAAHFLLGKTLEYKRRYTEARTAFEAAVRDSGNESVQRLATKSLADLPKESVPTP